MISCVPIPALPGASRRKRRTLKLSVRDAAKVAKVSPATLSRVECGGGLDAETYVRICAWLLKDAA